MTTPNQPNPPSLADFESACAVEADEFYFDGHACLDGDCPHEKARECFIVAQKEGANFARTFTLGSAEVRMLVNALESSNKTLRYLDGEAGASVIGAALAFNEKALEAFAKVRE